MRRILMCVLATVLSISVLIVVPDPSAAVVPGGIGRIAFYSTMHSTPGEIYVRDFSGGTPIRLTNNTSVDTGPQWSPDGSKIAFHTDRDGNYEIYVMNADGTGQINLSNNPATDKDLAWSPDGSRIAFDSDRSGNSEVYVMNTDSTGLANLTNNAAWDGQPAWSPDESTIAFASNRAGNAEVYVMNADGTDQINLSNNAARDWEPTWSPDGSRIAFVSTRDSNYEVYVMDTDGTGQKRLTDNSAYDARAAWSPDGSKIAFMSNRDGGDFDIFVMNPDGSDIVQLTDDPGTESSMDWEAVNRPPVAGDDTVTVPNGGSAMVTVTGNDSDPDGDVVTLEAIVSPPLHGTLSSLTATSVVYSHDGSSTTTDSFTYRITDGTLADAATVTVTVTKPDPGPVPTVPRFVDVPARHTFYGDIEWLASEGITKGCNPPVNDRYCPDANVTRGQMAAFLVRAVGYTDIGSGDLFDDDNTSIFEADIDRLATAGVTKGCNPPSNTRFCPDAYVTREQMAAFLVRAMGYADNGGGDLFDDDNTSIFETDIDRLGTAGVTKGCNPPTNDRFCPNAHVTRAQMAAFLNRALK